MTLARSPIAWVWLALSCGAGIALLAVVQCALPPSEDCSVTATCAVLGDATVMNVEAGAATESGATSSGMDGAANDQDVAVELSVPCGAGYACIPVVPSPWLGPFAEWIGTPDSGPACPTEFSGAVPVDSYTGLSASSATCTCTCVPDGQTCTATTTIFGDNACNSVCSTVYPTSACTTVTGCAGMTGSWRTDTPAPVGGTCVPTVPKVTPPKPTWSLAYRMCAPTPPDKNYTCSDGGEICAPVAAYPYSSRLCVGQIIVSGDPVPTSCPSGYPTGPTISYWNYADTRQCGTCTCPAAAPVGGSCAGTISMTGANVDNCTSGADTYTVGSACTAYSVSGPPARIEGDYTVTPADCGVPSNPPAAIGDASAVGPTQVICCM